MFARLIRKGSFDSEPTRRAGADHSRSWERLIVLANRAPLTYEPDANGRMAVKRSGGGLVTAIEPLMKRYGGIWVAHGDGNIDGAHVADSGELSVPPSSLHYRVRRVPLPYNEYRGYYYGFANEGLWPLCHALNVRPRFRPSDFRMYTTANSRFVDAVAAEAAASVPLVLVQDYHFALAPRLLRLRLPRSTIVSFWHIPWPTAREFSACPWARDLVLGLLPSDIIGVQTPDDCANLLDTVESTIDAEIDRRRHLVRWRGHTTHVRAYPVGVEWANDTVRATESASECRERVLRDFHLPAGTRLCVGVDRLDYTKGINDKLLVVERLLETTPALRGRFVFIQIAEPSRDCLPAYQSARAQIRETRNRVNARFATPGWVPIVLLETHHGPSDVYRLYRAADVCYVGSLRDGMNLVAKEFVCAREDHRGVLVLSQFAGAARQLRSALIVNPYAIEQTARVLADALNMSDADQAARMRELRANVTAYDAQWWAQQLIDDASRVSRTSKVAGRERRMRDTGGILSGRLAIAPTAASSGRGL
jgi:trehalose 6-phosphate synthase